MTNDGFVDIFISLTPPTVICLLEIRVFHTIVPRKYNCARPHLRCAQDQLAGLYEVISSIHWLKDAENRRGSHKIRFKLVVVQDRRKTSVVRTFIQGDDCIRILNEYSVI